MLFLLLMVFGDKQTHTHCVYDVSAYCYSAIFRSKIYSKVQSSYKFSKITIFKSPTSITQSNHHQCGFTTDPLSYSIRSTFVFCLRHSPPVWLCGLKAILFYPLDRCMQSLFLHIRAAYSPFCRHQSA